MRIADSEFTIRTPIIPFPVSAYRLWCPVQRIVIRHGKTSLLDRHYSTVHRCTWMSVYRQESFMVCTTYGTRSHYTPIASLSLYLSPHLFLIASVGTVLHDTAIRRWLRVLFEPRYTRIPRVYTHLSMLERCIRPLKIRKPIKLQRIMNAIGDREHFSVTSICKSEFSLIPMEHVCKMRCSLHSVSVST